MMHRYRGAYTALITPFTELGTVDYQSLERIVDSQIEAGIDGLVPCGTTGESPTLSHEEHDRVIAQTVKYAAGRVPVIAGTGSNATTEAIRLSQHAEDSGADAVLLVNPYYNKPTQKGLYLHFKANRSVKGVRKTRLTIERQLNNRRIAHVSQIHVMVFAKYLITPIRRKSLCLPTGCRRRHDKRLGISLLTHGLRIRMRQLSR